MKKLALVLMMIVPMLVGPIVMTANAKPPYAAKEKKACNYCHLTDSGGARGFRGLYYGAKKHSFKGFVEKTQAKKAGVKPGAMGKDSKAKSSYKPK